MHSLRFGDQFPNLDFTDRCIDYSQNSVEYTCHSPSFKPSSFEPEFPKTTNDSSVSQAIEPEVENFMNHTWLESYDDSQTTIQAPLQGFFNQTSIFFNSSPEKNEECARPIAQAIEEEKSPEALLFTPTKTLCMSSLGQFQTQKDFEFINDHTMEIEVQQDKFDLKSFAKGESSQRAQFFSSSPDQIPSSVDDSSSTSKSEQNLKKNLPVTTVFAVVSSLKKLFQLNSCPEEQRYLLDIINWFLPNEIQRDRFLEYLEGCKAGNSGRTWAKLKEKFRGKDVNMNRVLMRCVEAFLSQEGERDLEKYFKEGKMQKAAQNALRTEKSWFIKKLRKTFPDEFA